MEYADDGDLKHFIKHEEDVLSASEAKELMIQILKGLQYLHSYRFIHRDIKPDNLFKTKEKKFKIGDFGTARISDVFNRYITA